MGIIGYKSCYLKIDPYVFSGIYCGYSKAVIRKEIAIQTLPIYLHLRAKQFLTY